MGAYFSIPAFFIAIRETMEMVIVVGILVGTLRRAGLQHREKDIWIGTGAGIVLSVIVGVILGAIRWGTGTNVFSGNSEAIFSGVIFFVAVALLSYMIFWSMVNAKHMAKEITDELNSALDSKSRWSLMLLAFVQVAKEGIELVLLLMGATNTGSPASLPIPTILGIALSLILGYFFFRGSLKFNMQQFFFWSNLILIMFAAGLFSRAFHEFQALQWFGIYGREIFGEESPWWNQILWNLSWCCSPVDNGFFSVLNVLFGYTATPSAIEFFAYFSYWIIAICVWLAVNYKQVITKDRKVAKASTRTIWLSGYFMMCSVIGIIFASNKTPVPTNFSWNGIMISCIWCLVSVYGILTGFLRNTKHALAFFFASFFAFCLAIAYNIADLTQGTFSTSAGVERFFYWMLMFDTNGFPRIPGLSYVPGRYNVPISLLLITLYMNILICGGFVYNSWSYRSLLVRARSKEDDPVDVDSDDEYEEEVDVEKQAGGVDPFKALGYLDVGTSVKITESGPLSMDMHEVRIDSDDISSSDEITPAPAV